jgi:hypothetical protein
MNHGKRAVAASRIAVNRRNVMRLSGPSHQAFRAIARCKRVAIRGENAIHHRLLRKMQEDALA